ncbi:MAG: lytic transglycosylase domain-containing protein [Firmicutes bacterium]|nr:lytic transglycosylase domain-containing protein [Bacillota bacterium]
MSKNLWFTRSLAVLSAVLLLFYTALCIRYPRRYRDTVARISAEYSVPPPLVHAVIFAESGYNPNAVSPKGAVGLMQLMPQTARFCALKINVAFHEEKLTDPHYNLQLGVFYLSYLLEKFNSEADAIAAYNAGEGNVRSWIDRGLTEIPFKETRAYVNKVLSAQKIYRHFRL